MEHHVGSALVSRYGSSSQKPTYDPSRKGALFIAETRVSYWLPLVIRNALALHPDWNVYVAGTEDVLFFLNQEIGGEFRAIRLDAPPRITTQLYSALLTNVEVWNVFQEEYVLIFQTDSMLLKPVDLDKYGKFDYIGAACGDVQSPEEFIINGGLCLRNIQATRRALEAMTAEDREYPEDVSYCRVMRRLGCSLPTVAECNDFAIESFGNPASAVGIHGTDKYYCPAALLFALLGKKPEKRLIDAFCYNGEVQAVRARLRLMANVADAFVIVEAWETHAGTRKDQLFKDRDAELFAPYADKIRWVIVESFPAMPEGWGAAREGLWPWIKDHHEAWHREAYQRDQIVRALTEADKDSLVFVSDADELPNPAALVSVAQHATKPLYFEMEFLLYSPEWRRTKERWQRAYLAPVAVFASASPTEIRCAPGEKPVVTGAGWHCSFFYSAEDILRKTKSFAHQEHNTEKNLNLDLIRHRMRSGRDPFGQGNDAERVGDQDLLWLEQLLH